MNLWTTAQAAAHLGIRCPRTTKRKLLEWGVLPVPLGRGRGLGDRWRPNEVEAALDRLQGKIVLQASHRAAQGGILGRDIKELIRELTTPSPRQ